MAVTLTGASAETIRTELLARHDNLRAAGLALSDATGAPVDASFLTVVDVLAPDVDARILLGARLIQVAAMFGS